MNAMKQIRKLFKDSKGVATSLVEATATIAVGAVLAGAAVTTGLDAIESARIQSTTEQVRTIGLAVITFYQDNGIYPGYESGTATGPQDDDFENLASRNGNYPTDTTLTWDVPQAPTAATTGGTPGYISATFGHLVEPTSDAIENHLVTNTINDSSSNSYPLRGTSAFGSDTTRGWNGPYPNDGLPATDAWGSKFLINVEELNSTGVVNGTTAIFVISAGPDRTISTSATQCIGNTAPCVTDPVITGDDIVYRIR